MKKNIYIKVAFKSPKELKGNNFPTLVVVSGMWKIKDWGDCISYGMHFLKASFGMTTYKLPECTSLAGKKRNV